MSLKAADVAEIMRIVEESGFDELTLEIEGLKLSLRRGAAGMVNGAAFESESSAGDASEMSSQARRQSAGADASGTAGRAGARGGAAAGGSSSTRVSASRGGAASGGAPTSGTATAGHATAAGAHSAAASPAPAVVPPTDPNLQDVKAPLLGTFYRSPKPGAPPFVDVGATVEEDTVVAIIEVMKLMNTVRAGVRGVVTEIFANDGALVEYDEPILRVRKAG